MKFTLAAEPGSRRSPGLPFCLSRREVLVISLACGGALGRCKASPPSGLKELGLQLCSCQDEVLLLFLTWLWGHIRALQGLSPHPV